MEFRAEVVSIGDEITSGVRVDTNTAWISKRLGDIGIRVAFHSTVGDELEDNVEVFRIAAQRADIVISTGGLGPTADDLTRHAIGKMAGVELVKDDQVLDHIKQMYTRRGRDMPVNNEIQAWFPAGANVIDNPEGTAPGIDFGGANSDDRAYRIFALPGVPVEMKQMWEATVEPELKSLVGNDFVIAHHTVHCFGSGESQIETMLPDLVKRGRDPSVGITASSATISLRVSTRAATIEECHEKMKPTIATIQDCLGDLVFGENGQQLEEVVVGLLQSKSNTIAIADFGFGGAVSQLIEAVDVSQSVLVHSEFSNDDVEVLFGGLEKAAEAVRTKSGADLGIAISEIDRDKDRVSRGESLHRAVIWNGDSAALGEFRFGGHSGWREKRAMKEVLNFMRLHLKVVKP